MLALHPAEGTANGPLPGSVVPRASLPIDPGPLAQGCVSDAGDSAKTSQTSVDSDRKARVDAFMVWILLCIGGLSDEALMPVTFVSGSST